MINMQALKREFQSSNRGVLRFNGGFFRFNGKILSLTGGQQCGYHIAWERRNACCWYINRLDYLGLLALFIFPFCRSVLPFFLPRLLRCYFRKPSACFIVGIEIAELCHRNCRRLRRHRTLKKKAIVMALTTLATFNTGRRTHKMSLGNLL